LNQRSAVVATRRSQTAFPSESREGRCIIIPPSTPRFVVRPAAEFDIIMPVERLYYRSGASLKARRNDVRIDPQTGKLRSTRGISVYDLPDHANLTKFGGIYQRKKPGDFGLKPRLREQTSSILKLRDGEAIRVRGEHREIADKLARTE
jgi:hypothetical protein